VVVDETRVGGRLVCVGEFVADKIDALAVLVGSLILGKTHGERHALHLRVKQVLLVEKQNHIRRRKPSVVHNVIEKLQEKKN
jgi:hypothetical protein